MGSKRGVERIETVKGKLYEGMARKGITGDRADAIYVKILSFAGLRLRRVPRPQLRAAGLRLARGSSCATRLPSSPGCCATSRWASTHRQSLVADARRHGVTVLPPDLARSGALAGLEPCTPYGKDRHRYDDGLAVRLGLDEVKGIGKEIAERIVAERAVAPYQDLPDLSRRAGLTTAQLEALATAGAFASLGLDRRQAIWMAGYAEHDGQLPGSTPAPAPPTLPGMSPMEVTLADLWATRISTDVHPVQHFREQLSAAGIRAVGDLRTAEAGRRVHVAGLITHRQRPGTASGITFLNLEDETGMLNVVCSPGVMKAHRQAARNKVAVVIRGMVERQDGVTNLVADRVETLDTVLPGTGEALQARQSSRDFR